MTKKNNKMTYKMNATQFNNYCKNLIAAGHSWESIEQKVRNWMTYGDEDGVKLVLV